MGISVVTSLVQDLLEYFGQEAVVTECHRMLAASKLDVYGILGTDHAHEGHVQRSFLLFINKQSSSDLPKGLPELLTHLEGVQNFQLNSKVMVPDAPNEGLFVHYRLGNSSVSRKAIEAVLKKYYL